MELTTEQKEEIIVKLGILSHLLESAAQTMKDIVSIAEGAKEKEIEELIANHTAEGLEMISKFLDEASE
tara:strand:+ start:11198 stop:11404 length:207 start_codon:yes stop_codon:yes gene_type:complete